MCKQYSEDEEGHLRCACIAPGARWHEDSQMNPLPRNRIQCRLVDVHNTQAKLELLDMIPSKVRKEDRSRIARVDARHSETRNHAHIQ